MSIKNAQEEKNIFNLCFERLNEIDKSDIVFFSLRMNPEAKFKTINGNRIILSYIRKRTNNIFVGGRGANYLKEMSDMNCKLVIGKNLNQFNPKKNIQILNDSLPPNSERYHYYPELYVPEYEFSYNKILSNYHLDELLDSKDERYLKSIIFSIEKSGHCYHNCAFCEHAHTNQKETDIDLSLKSLKSFIVSGGYNCGVFLDCSFNKTKLLNSFHRFITENGINFSYFAGIRLKELTEKDVKLLKESGLVCANIGIESLENSVLKNMNKGITIEEVEEKILLLHEYDIFLNTNFIINLPYSSKFETEKIYGWVKKFPEGTINGICINPLYILQNSFLYKTPMKFGIQIFPGKIREKIYIDKYGKSNLSKKSEDILNYSKYSDKTFNLNYYFYLIFVLMNKFKDKTISLKYFNKFLKSVYLKRQQTCEFL